VSILGNSGQDLCYLRQLHPHSAHARPTSASWRRSMPVGAAQLIA